LNTKALQAFHSKLRADQPVYGLWSTLPSPDITDMAVSAGLDWVTIDAEHGSFDWRNIEAHIRATVRSSTVVLIRVSELNISLFKRALDIGADGVAVPFISTAEQMRTAVQYAQFPPRGQRAVGGDRATGWGQCFAQHVAEADDQVIVLPNLETVEAATNVEQIAAVPGTNVYFFGPADFSASAGHAGQWEGPGVAEALLGMKDRIRARGKHCGIIATSLEDIQRRREQGFRMIGVGVDSGLLIRGLGHKLALLGKESALNASLTPLTEATSTRKVGIDL
jgi:2-keto-3-deoxy-L-rhamnonate aldolase RhmA